MGNKIENKSRGWASRGGVPALQLLESLYSGQLTLSSPLIKPNFCEQIFFVHKNLVLSTDLIMSIDHYKGILKLFTFHPHNHAAKSIILNNFKLLQNDPKTRRIFLQPPLISFKRDKNVGNFLVRSTLKTNCKQPSTFKCTRSRCKTCPFILNTSKILGPKRSVKITNCFTCTSTSVIYCKTCMLCNNLYIGKTLVDN